MNEDTAMTFDVVIVGAGPAGLAAAIRLAQLNQAENQSVSICVLEKGAEVGAHILSGAVIDPKALNELLPDWQSNHPPPHTPVTQDEFLWLSANKARRMPVPPQMHNKGNFIISLGSLCRYLAGQAESLGVEIFPGFAAAKVLFNDDNQVCGVETGPMGVAKDGSQKASYQPPMQLYAKQTLFAEGCRGVLSEKVIKHYHLRDKAQHQTYALGIKELWEVPEAQHQAGKVIHTIGWPLKNDTYGGSFIYHLDNHQIAIGFVVGLDYENPTLSPFQELQRFKHHPHIAPMFKDGKRIAYGARALNEGGIQSLPKLTFPGGLLIGCSAGFLNVPKIKGSHTAMKSGMLAAETVFKTLSEEKPVEVKAFSAAIKKSWVWDELYRARNIRPMFHKGLYAGLMYAAVDTYLFRGKAPWTFRHAAPDHKALHHSKLYPKIEYPKPDGVLSFDRLSSVYLSNTNHEEDQPGHLVLKQEEVAIKINYKDFSSPETFYCPAGVYEIVAEDAGPRLQINHQNCVHCKTCDIKDPTQNIVWTLPEGGGGPLYNYM